MLREGYFPQEIKQEVWKAQNGYCKLCSYPIQEFHHRVPNTKPNRKLFPLFVVSIFNCVGLCQGCHANRKHELMITIGEARAYENYLYNLVRGLV